MKNQIEPCPACGVVFDTEEEALQHEKDAHGSLTLDELVMRNKMDRVVSSELPGIEAYDKYGGERLSRKIKKFKLPPQE